MKLTFSLFLLFTTLIGLAQEKEIVPLAKYDSIYNYAGIEKKPEYPGGIGEFYKHISRNYSTPKDKDFKGGKVIVSFVIEKDGSVADVKVIRDLGFGSGEEAIRVLKNSKNWIPAEQKGNKVRCHFILPISLGTN